MAALLIPYFEKDTPHATRMMIADDWIEALAEYPQWAIERAVRWWKGPENERRHRTPLEGDIAARCRVEMMAVNAAKTAMRLKAPLGSRGAEPERPQVSPEDAARRAAVVAETLGRFPSQRAQADAEDDQA